MSDELKPCPFCGTTIPHPQRNGFYYCVRANWNTRPIEDALRWQIVELKAALEFQKSAARQLSGMTNIGISVYDALTPEQIKLLRSGKPCRWVLEEA